ncbi:hypothetical protein LV779_39070 [Streptomyces thinghirensis]|nr:hypothetical protein [Streptomyces thinghirensis]
MTTPARAATPASPSPVGRALTFTPSNWNTAQQVTIAADASGTGSAVFESTAPGHGKATVNVTQLAAAKDYDARFLELYGKITDPANGYFSPEGIPYHSVETLIVEAPDHGHETTSEAYSYLLWLQAMYGKVTGDWTRFNNAWEIMETYMIPTHADQPTNSAYNASKPATYAPELDTPEEYPAPLDGAVSVGPDPIAAELEVGVRHGRRLRHALAPGRRQHLRLRQLARQVRGRPHGHRPLLHQHLPARRRSRCGRRCRGRPATPSARRSEGTWTCSPVTRPTPSSGSSPTPRTPTRGPCRPRTGPTFWGRGRCKGEEIAGTPDKAAKMGDYLRYAMFDKYFKKVGDCVVRRVARPAPARTPALPAVLVLRLGRRWTPRRLGLAHRLQPHPRRLPEPAGGVRAEHLRRPEA